MRPLRIVVAILVLAIVAIRFVMRDARSHSASDTLRPFALEVVVAIVVAVIVVRVIEWAVARRRP